MTLQFHDRPYRDEADLLRMRGFLSSSYGERGLLDSGWHVGDMTWAVFLNSLVGPIDRGRLWTTPDDTLLGFSWSYKGHSEFVIDPAIRHTADGRRLAIAMIGWLDAERHRTNAAEPLRIGCNDAMPGPAALFEELGFTRDESDPLLIFRRHLAMPLPAVQLPPGFTVRPLTGPEEFADRVAIHSEVWHPSKVTVEGFARLQTMPGFDPALDLVAVAPDGRFAAYATLWHDPLTRSGEFEPVGAREEFRGKGLAKAVLIEALRRLAARDATTAWVCTDFSRTAARALYASVGFEQVGRIVSYVRE